MRVSDNNILMNNFMTAHSEYWIWAKLAEQYFSVAAFSSLHRVDASERYLIRLELSWCFIFRKMYSHLKRRHITLNSTTPDQTKKSFKFIHCSITKLVFIC